MTNRQFLDGSHGGNKLSRNRMWLLKWKFQDVTEGATLHPPIKPR
jgi:hypothetical protein